MMFSRGATVAGYVGMDASDNLTIQRGGDAGIAATINRTTGAVSLAGTLGVTGLASFAAGVAVTGGTAAVTGNATVGGTLGVTGLVTAAAGVTVTGGAAGTGRIFKDADVGLVIQTIAGVAADFAVTNPAGSANILVVPTGTNNVEFPGDVRIDGDLSLAGGGDVTFGASDSGGDGFRLLRVPNGGGGGGG